MKLVGWDYGSKEGDIGVEIYGRWSKKGRLIIEDVKFIKPKKGVKKVRPYFETKIIKVKKKEKEWTPDCCPCCGAKREAEKPLTGNWVNGENLDKIKFPCFCSYTHGSKKIGILLKLGNSFYITNIEDQVEHNRYFLSYDLKHLIEDFNIRILKGKIIIYDEVDTNGKYDIDIEEES